MKYSANFFFTKIEKWQILRKFGSVLTKKFEQIINRG